jgi:exopolysaccharide biosynthesis polyprenyl glycosylphosphotransferase
MEIDAPATGAPARPGSFGLAAGAAIAEAENVGSVSAREATTRRLLVLADAAGAAMAFLIVSAISHGATGLAVLVAVPIIALIHKLAGLYDRDELLMQPSTLDELPALVQLAGLYALVTFLVSHAVLPHALGPRGTLALWLLGFALVAGGRMAARTAIARTVPRERCLVVGDHERVVHVRRKLETSTAPVEVAAAVLCTPERPRGVEHLEDLRSLVRAHDVHRVIIAPFTSTTDTVELIRMVKAVGVRVSLLPRTLEAVGSAVEFDEVDGLTMLGVRRFGLSRSSRAIKRAFDFLVGVVVAVGVAPLMAAIAIAIRLDSGGPVFFRQPRVGQNGEPFRIWKFRSMVADAEALKDALRPISEGGEGLFKLRHDPRVTRVGRLLRRTSLDELPQILNVLRGDMSLVGPRPLVADEDARIVGFQRSRLHLKPGMTGPWQVLGATRVPLDEMVAMDYLYVANWSLWTDVKLLLRTVAHVMAGRGL